MAHLGGTFDANSVAPSQAFEPLPSGEYLAYIIDSDMKQTNARDGEYLELTYEVIDGPMKGRKVWSRLNLRNSNPKAEEIAQRDLSAICHAVGVLQVTDSQQLHYKPHVIRVEYVKADGARRQRDGNEVKAYKRADGAAPQSQGQDEPKSWPAPSGQSASGAPPWAQRPAA